MRNHNYNKMEENVKQSYNVSSYDSQSWLLNERLETHVSQSTHIPSWWETVETAVCLLLSDTRIVMFGAFNMFPEPLRPFNQLYRCYSVSMLPGNERSDVEKGGKIIMPPSALDQLTRLNIVYPMLFKLTNVKTERITHCGVLEFVADEGKVYLPYW